MISLWQDLRYSVRMLRRSPGFTATAVLTLALGIGATSAIFSVVNGVMLRPFPYREPDRLVVVWEQNLERGLPYMYAAPPNYADWRGSNSVFDDMGAFAWTRLVFEADGTPQLVRGAEVTASMFDVVGATPRIGRSFTAADDRPDADPVIILSHAMWENRFGADPEIIGRSIRLGGTNYSVIGVMPPDFEFPPPIVLEGAIPTEPTEFWIPFAMEMAGGNRGAHFMNVIARLEPGVELAEAEAELSTIARRLQQEYPSSNAGWDVVLTPFDHQVLGDARIQLLILLGAVGLVLLIACVNVANLLLARGTTRVREFALRASLGAERGRLVRQLLTESIGLSAIAGIAGLIIAVFGARLLVQLAPQDIPRLHEVGLDSRVLAFTLIVSILTGVLFGLAPAFQGITENLSERLREGGRGQAGGGAGSRLRSGLVVAEVALSLVLLVGAGLLLESFVNLRGVETGFEAMDRVTMRVTLPSSRYEDRASLITAYGELEERLNAAPGIAAAGFVSEVPLAADRGGTSFLKEGESDIPEGENRTVNFAVVTPTYFQAMGVPLRQGRGFTAADGPDAEPVVVVNDAFVRQHFAGVDPIGRRIGFPGRWFRIVGVVTGVRHASLRDDPNPSIYVAYAQFPQSRSMSLVVSSDVRPDAALGAARAAIHEYDSAVPIYDVMTMEQVLGESLARARFSTWLMALFALIALVLAAVGIYGVIAYAVSRRTQEIGVRVAIGARAADVLRLVLGQGMRLAALGIVVGVLVAVALARVLQSQLYGVGAADPLVLAAVIVILSGIAALACYVPARRATRVNPVEALRHE
ncbi:MAG: ABC transporter permease [Gemmatimonadetes bacterium]|uniref:ABC transporter permease n=1 Tax=Candidatus Kutchimonas denitrificans TaxID=3056748 RepID=A0AAE4ZBF8_9BACT|nr:ABC transporter permease [Gemmatimonadota bacterium]NIR76162.1 ABC transporter permease [Candidatus Kutchimonas denitrificans]NIS00602.1 ABC transporter permease [Gemmatimonadota bacterium]NIT66747.1 ABC transporter permease [Gemmatimonadota bacterium]NIV23346.1 FtsX-like permease family protein [Gemmatimonadota bacterium]